MSRLHRCDSAPNGRTRQLRANRFTHSLRLVGELTAIRRL